MKPLKPHVKSILSQAFVGLLFASLALSACFWLAGQMQRINQAIATKQTIRYKLANQQSVVARLERDFAGLPSSYQSRIDQALPPVNNILPFVEALEGLAQKNGLDLTHAFANPELANGLAAGNYLLAPIRFNLTLSQGNVPAVRRFLADLEELPFFSSINNLSFASAKGWNDTTTATIGGIIYARQ